MLKPVLQDIGGVLAILGLYAVLPIGGAAKLAKVAVPVALLAWAIYFGAFGAWMGMASRSWNETVAWMMILNMFTGFGVLPTTIIAWIINKVIAK